MFLILENNMTGQEIVKAIYIYALQLYSMKSFQLISPVITVLDVLDILPVLFK
jgi:hypothetical protein